MLTRRLLIFSAIVLLLTTVGAMWLPTPHDPLSQATADRIKPGMTFREVDAILCSQGFVLGGDEVERRRAGGTIWGGITWEYQHSGLYERYGKIVVGFGADGTVHNPAKVSTVWQRGPLDRIRGWLPW